MRKDPAPGQFQLEQAYESLTNRLYQAIQSPFGAEDEEHLSAIKDLEDKLVELGKSSSQSPRFFSWGKMFNLRLLFHDSAKYKKLSGIQEQSRYSELRDNIRTGKLGSSYAE